MPTESEKKARASVYQPYVAERAYSFELSEELLEKLKQRHDPDEMCAKFAEKIAGKGKSEVESIAAKEFTIYGEQLIRDAIKLGKEYLDRTYEILMEAVDQTGEMSFPLVLQRFIEIAYLATQRLRYLPIVENWRRRLVYKIADCYIYSSLAGKCGKDIADILPCRHACLALCRAGCEALGVDAVVKAEAEMPKDGYCQFAINRV